MTTARPLLPSDLYKVVLAVDPQIAPDGTAVIYRRCVFDPEKDATLGALWRVGTNGSDDPFTSGPDDRLPRFATDGARIAFVRIAEEKARIFVIPPDGGDALPVSEEYKAISSLAWSRDGRQIAFTATAAYDPGTAHIYVDDKSGARHIRALPYKSDPAGLLDGRRSHLFVLDVAAGATRQLTTGDFDVSDPNWSPDGRTIACALGAAIENSPIADIAVLDVESFAMRRLTDADGPNSAPAFSPDGRRIAWLGHRHGSDTRYGSELFVSGVDGSNRRSLSAAMDRLAENTVNGDVRPASAAGVRWRNDREIAGLVTNGPNVSLYAFDADSGERHVIAGGEREIYAFSLAPTGVVAIGYSSPVVPSAIATLVPVGMERCLTELNPWLTEKSVAAPRRFAVSAKDGTQLDCFLMMPEGTTAPPPVVLEIHGGPHGTYGNTFFLEFQLLAACGFAVVYGNPRGSAGYGQAFASAITGDWGGVDASDLLDLLDGGLAAEQLDSERVAVVGGSYGGLMTTWLLGHANRFVTGISMRAVNDFVSFTGATDIGYFLNAELGFGLDGDSMRSLFERSPIRAAEHIDVPMLIMHSENDYRCPIDQGEQLFNVLRMLGKKNVEFVRFVGDGHGLSRGGKPRHRILRLRAIAHWLQCFLPRVPSDAGMAAAGSLFRPLSGEPAESLPS